MLQIGENAGMAKLRGTMMTSIAIAFLSTSFLYASYVQSALAQSSVAEAASIEYVEEIIELIVIDDTETDDYVETDEVKDLSIADNTTSDSSENIDFIEVEVTSKQESLRLPEIETSFSDAGHDIEQAAVENPSDLAYQKIIEEIHLRSNIARLKRGHFELSFDALLSDLALERSEDMSESEYFSHTSPDGCDLVCNFKSSEYETLVWGENIAKYKPYNNTTKGVIAEIFVEKWLKSSAHRDNLLSDKFTHHGIGVSVVNEEMVVTVIFAAP